MPETIQNNLITETHADFFNFWEWWVNSIELMKSKGLSNDQALKEFFPEPRDQQIEITSQDLAGFGKHISVTSRVFKKLKALMGRYVNDEVFSYALTSDADIESLELPPEVAFLYRFVYRLPASDSDEDFYTINPEDIDGLPTFKIPETLKKNTLITALAFTLSEVDELPAPLTLASKVEAFKEFFSKYGGNRYEDMAIDDPMPLLEELESTNRILTTLSDKHRGALAKLKEIEAEFVELTTGPESYNKDANISLEVLKGEPGMLYTPELMKVLGGSYTIKPAVWKKTGDLKREYDKQRQEFKEIDIAWTDYLQEVYPKKDELISLTNKLIDTRLHQSRQVTGKNYDLLKGKLALALVFEEIPLAAAPLFLTDAIANYTAAEKQERYRAIAEELPRSEVFTRGNIPDAALKIEVRKELKELDLQAKKATQALKEDIANEELLERKRVLQEQKARLSRELKRTEKVRTSIESGERLARELKRAEKVRASIESGERRYDRKIANEAATRTIAAYREETALIQKFIAATPKSPRDEQKYVELAQSGVINIKTTGTIPVAEQVQNSSDLKSMFRIYVNALEGNAAALDASFAEAARRVSRSVGGTVESFTEAAKKVQATVATTARDAFVSTRAAAERRRQQAADAVSSGIDTVTGGIRSGIDTVTGGISSGVDTLAGGIRSGVDAIAEGAGRFTTAVTGAVGAVADRIAAAFRAVRDKIKSMVTTVTNFEYTEAFKSLIPEILKTKVVTAEEAEAKERAQRLLEQEENVSRRMFTGSLVRQYATMKQDLNANKTASYEGYVKYVKGLATGYAAGVGSSMIRAQEREVKRRSEMFVEIFPEYLATVTETLALAEQEKPYIERGVKYALGILKDVAVGSVKALGYAFDKILSFLGLTKEDVVSVAVDGALFSLIIIGAVSALTAAAPALAAIIPASIGLWIAGSAGVVGTSIAAGWRAAGYPPVVYTIIKAFFSGLGWIHSGVSKVLSGLNIATDTIQHSIRTMVLGNTTYTFKEYMQTIESEMLTAMQDEIIKSYDGDKASNIFNLINGLETDISDLALDSQALITRSPESEFATLLNIFTIANKEILSAVPREILKGAYHPEFKETLQEFVSQYARIIRRQSRYVLSDNPKERVKQLKVRAQQYPEQFVMVFKMGSRVWTLFKEQQDFPNGILHVQIRPESIMIAREDMLYQQIDNVLNFVTNSNNILTPQFRLQYQNLTYSISGRRYTPVKDNTATEQQALDAAQGLLMTVSQSFAAATLIHGSNQIADPYLNDWIARTQQTPPSVLNSTLLKDALSILKNTLLAALLNSNEQIKEHAELGMQQLSVVENFRKEILQNGLMLKDIPEVVKAISYLSEAIKQIFGLAGVAQEPSAMGSYIPSILRFETDKSFLTPIYAQLAVNFGDSVFLHVPRTPLGINGNVRAELLRTLNQGQPILAAVMDSETVQFAATAINNANSLTYSNASTTYAPLRETIFRDRFKKFESGFAQPLRDFQVIPDKQQQPGVLTQFPVLKPAQPQLSQQAFPAQQIEDQAQREQQQLQPTQGFAPQQPQVQQQPAEAQVAAGGRAPIIPIIPQQIGSSIAGPTANVQGQTQTNPPVGDPFDPQGASGLPLLPVDLKSPAKGHGRRQSETAATEEAPTQTRGSK